MTLTQRACDDINDSTPLSNMTFAQMLWNMGRNVISWLRKDPCDRRIKRSMHIENWSNVNLVVTECRGSLVLVQVSLLLIVQQILASCWLDDCANCMPTPRKMTNTVQHQPLLVQYKPQANPILSMHNYTPLVISGNDKNKQLTLLSQCKHALNGRNMWMIQA